MEKRIVRVHTPQGELKVELIQFITVREDNGNIAILAVCMDQSGFFDTYAMADIQGAKFT